MNPDDGGSNEEYDDLLFRFRHDESGEVVSEVFYKYEKQLADFIRKTVPRYLRNSIGGTTDLSHSVLLDLLSNRDQIASNSQLVSRHLSREDDELWRLLVSIVIRHHEKHKKRNQRRPQDFRSQSIDNELERQPDRKPQTESSNDVVETICRQLNENERIVFLNYWIPRATGVTPLPTQNQIVAEFGISKRTVERIVNELKSKISVYISE